MVRKLAGKRCRPTAAILDSQSVKSDPHGGVVGYDAAKRIKGRKRHLLVDTMGLLLGIEITPADVPEREGARACCALTLGGGANLRLVRDYEKTESSAAAWTYIAMIRIQLRRLA